MWLPWEGAAFLSGDDGPESLGLPRSNMTPEILHNQTDQKVVRWVEVFPVADARRMGCKEGESQDGPGGPEDKTRL